MKLSALLAPLIEAKADHETIMKMVLAFEAQQTDALESSREKARNRWHKWKEKQPANVSKRLLTDSNTLTRAVEDKPLPTETNKPKKQNTGADLDAFKGALSGVCDSDRIEAFVKLRRTKRGQLTGHAANLFKTDAAKCGLSIPDAIDTCIRRNWITVEPEWLAKPHSRAGPSQQAPSMSQILEVIRDQASADEPEHPEDRSSLRAAIPHLRAVGAG